MAHILLVLIFQPSLIAGTFNVSRVTIRNALSELVQLGYLGGAVLNARLWRASTGRNLQVLCSFTDKFISRGILLVTNIKFPDC
jgi:hypothetical protein